MKRRAWLTMLCLLAARVGLAAQVVAFDDGSQGVTCEYLSAAARLEWQRPGGDWDDARGAAYGSEAFDSAVVREAPGLQTVRWDMTEIAKRWSEAREPIGAVFLRPIGGRRNGTVNFRSREHPDEAGRPSLLVEWDDGEQSRLAASVDTYFGCPTHRSLGNEPLVKVGGGQGALLVFPFEARPGHAVHKAEMALTSDKQYAGGTVIGVFRPLLPSSGSSPARAGLAAGFRNDVGIEKDPDVLFADRFEQPSWDGAWTGMTGEGDAEMTSEDPKNRFEPFDGKALKATIRAGVNQGLNANLRFGQLGKDEPEEAYFRYYLRLAENWDPALDGGKLPGLSGTYGRGGWGMRRSDGRNGWSARGAFFPFVNHGSPGSDLRGVGSYVYHAAMSGNSGDIWGWSLGPTGLLHKNRWYCVEQHVRLNRPGDADGVLEAWIDGKLVFEKKNIRYRDTPELKIESVWMNVYHGGTRPAAQDLSVFIDNVVVARKYIGPVGPAH